LTSTSVDPTTREGERMTNRSWQALTAVVALLSMAVGCSDDPDAGSRTTTPLPSTSAPDFDAEVEEILAEPPATVELDGVPRAVLDAIELTPIVQVCVEAHLERHPDEADAALSGGLDDRFLTALRGVASTCESTATFADQFVANAREQSEIDQQTADCLLRAFISEDPDVLNAITNNATSPTGPHPELLQRVDQLYDSCGLPAG